MFKFLDQLKKTASKIGGHSDPEWLAAGTEPHLDTYETGDNGPVIILLHGLFGAVSNWDGVLPHFSKFSRTIAVKFPIFTGKKNEVKVKALALLTEYFIRSRGYDKVVLCGNSLGGHVALRLTLACPDLVDKLILSGSSGLYEHTVSTLPMKPDVKFVQEHMDRVFHKKEFITPERIAESVDVLNDRKRITNLIHAAKSAKHDNLEKLLPEIKVPTLLIWGENDQVTDMQVARQFNSLIPNSKLVSMKECGHAPMIEEPEWFAGEVEKFVR